MDKNKILNKPFVCVKWVLFLKQCSVTLSRFATYCRRILLHRLHQRQHGWFIKKIDYFLNVSSHHFRVHRRHIENQVILYAKYMYLLKVNAFENLSKYIFNHLINVSIYTFLYSNWLCKNEQKYFHDFIIHYNFI